MARRSRRGQTYKVGGAIQLGPPTAVDGTPNIWRIYKTWTARTRAIGQFKRRFNYIVGWRDTQGWGLQVTNAEWMKEQKYVKHYINLR